MPPQQVPGQRSPVDEGPPTGSVLGWPVDGTVLIRREHVSKDLLDALLTGAGGTPAQLACVGPCLGQKMGDFWQHR